MLLGGLIAFWRPSAFTWFVKRGPDSYSAALGIIMLAMGFTLQIKDLLHVLTKRPVAVSFSFQTTSRLSYKLKTFSGLHVLIYGLRFKSVGKWSILSSFSVALCFAMRY